MKTNIRIWPYIPRIFLEWEMFQMKIVEKIKTHFVFSNISFFENRAVYEITWKNTVQPDRPQMAMWRMPIARCIPKAKVTHSEYVILTALPRQQWLYERASMLSYTYPACLVITTQYTCVQRMHWAERNINLVSKGELYGPLILHKLPISVLNALTGTENLKPPRHGWQLEFKTLLSLKG